MSKLECFKSYDVRGRVGDNLDEAVAYRIGRATAQVLDASRIAVGRDIRESSPALLDALTEGMRDAGAEVLDIGLCGTEEVYFATDHYAACAGVMVTASHNPIDYNGFKIVGPGARPLTDGAFREIERIAATVAFNTTQRGRGTRRAVQPRDAYVERVCSFVRPSEIGPIQMVANPGNGCAGPTFDAVLDRLRAHGAQIDVSTLHHVPDGSFPNGIPNPLLPENQPVTSAAILRSGADLGVAWDGDFDRCFLFDETGAFIPGEFVVGLLAEAVLERNSNAAVVYDPRVVWNTRRVVDASGGRAVMSRTGHVLVKDKMRETNALYGGEMSAHHYFRDFMYCESGMIPWVLMLARLSARRERLSDLVRDMREKHPSSGEINFRVACTDAVTSAISDKFRSAANIVDTLDGVSMEFDDWRFNLRASNTEPLLRLNVEALGRRDLLDARVAELTEAIEAVA